MQYTQSFQLRFQPPYYSACIQTASRYVCACLAQPAGQAALGLLYGLFAALPSAVTVLIGSDGNKTMMAVGVSKNALARGLKAGALVKKIAAIAGGNGGGKPDFAMAGIRDTSKIDDALNAVPEIVKAEMNQ